MKITDKKEKLTVTVPLNVEAADYSEIERKKLSDFRRKADIKGFRKGNVPMSLVQRLYGDQALVEAVNEVIGKGLQEYIDSNKLHVLGEPLQSESQKEVEWKSGADFEFAFDIAFAPEVNVEAVKEDTVNKYNITPSAKEKEEMVANLTKYYEEKKEGEPKTAEEIAAEVDARLADNYSQEAEWKLSKDIRDFYVKKAGVELPEAFLKRWLIEVNKGKVSAEEVEKEFDDVAEGEKPWKNVISDFYSTFEPMVSDTMSRKDEHKVGERVLGIDPASGKPVSVKIGRFGPIVQIGSADDEEKPRFAQMKKGQTLETITMEEAMELFRLPRTLGEFEDATITVGTGRFGPYIRHQNMYVSLQGKADPLEITLEEAVALITEKRESESKKVIKTYDEEPEMEILNGRYGPYISYKGSNYKIPKTKVPADLTLEECNAIIQAQIDKNGSAPRRRIFKAKK